MDSTAKLLEKYLNAHLTVVLIWGGFILFKSPPVWTEVMVLKAMDVVTLFIGGGYIKDAVVSYISRPKA